MSHSTDSGIADESPCGVDVMDAARNVVEDYPGGAVALAPRVSKTPATLSHEVHESGFAKLGLRTAVKITKRTRDLRILNAFAADCGCMVLPLPSALAVEGSDSMALVSKLAGEFNDVVQAYVKAMADGKVKGNELHDIRRQWGELQVAGQRLVAHAEALHEAGRPAHLRAAS